MPFLPSNLACRAAASVVAAFLIAAPAALVQPAAARPAPDSFADLAEKPCAYWPIVAPTSSPHQPDKDDASARGRQPRQPQGLRRNGKSARCGPLHAFRKKGV